MRLTTRLAGVRDADAGAGNTAQYELAAAAPPPPPPFPCAALHDAEPS